LSSLCFSELNFITQSPESARHGPHFPNSAICHLTRRRGGVSWRLTFIGGRGDGGESCCACGARLLMESLPSRSTEFLEAVPSLCHSVGTSGVLMPLGLGWFAEVPQIPFTLSRETGIELRQHHSCHLWTVLTPGSVQALTGDLGKSDIASALRGQTGTRMKGQQFCLACFLLPLGQTWSLTGGGKWTHCHGAESQERRCLQLGDCGTLVCIKGLGAELRTPVLPPGQPHWISGPSSIIWGQQWHLKKVKQRQLVE
jgi:hypothetical protein